MKNIRSRSKRFCMHGGVHVLCAVLPSTTIIRNCTYIYTIIHIVYSQLAILVATVSNHLECQLVVPLELCICVTANSPFESIEIFNPKSNHISQWFGVITRGVRLLLISVVSIECCIFPFWGTHVGEYSISNRRRRHRHLILFMVSSSS